MDPGDHRRAWRELLIAARFSTVGATATLVHLGIVFALIEASEVPPLAANSFAFLSAFAISFVGNYWWTFERSGSPRTAMRRFFLVSSIAFAVNMLALANLLSAGWLEPSIAAVAAALVIPAATFLAGRFWAFRPT